MTPRYIAAIALLALSAAPVHAERAEREACDFERAERAIDRKSFDAAWRHFEACRAANLGPRVTAKAMLGLARSAFLAGDMGKARDQLRLARDFVVLAFGDEDVAMAGVLQLSAIIKLQVENDRAGAQADFQAASRIRNAKVPAWDGPAQADGPFRHRASGLAFRAAFGAFTLTQRTINDDDGIDVSVGYRAAGPNGAVTLTIAAYRPRIADPAEFWLAEVRTIRTFNPQAEAMGEEAARFAVEGGELTARTAKFRYRGPDGDLGTRLYIFRFEGRTDAVKFRVTHRWADDGAVDAMIAEAVKALGWPKK